MEVGRPTQNTGNARRPAAAGTSVGSLDGDSPAAALYGDRGAEQTSITSLPQQFSVQATITQLLLEREGKLIQAILENVPVMVTVLDSGNNALYVNKEYERVMGWTEEEVRQMDIVSACLPDPAERNEALEFLRRAEPVWGEFRIRNKWGIGVPTMWMNVRVGAVLFGIGIDMTERRQREAVAQKAREDVEARVERRIPPADPYGLTFRELTVLTFVAEGKTDREIASLLSIGCRTVQTHISKILTKMGAKVRTEAGVRAVREGIIE